MVLQLQSRLKECLDPRTVHCVTNFTINEAALLQKYDSDQCTCHKSALKTFISDFKRSCCLKWPKYLSWWAFTLQWCLAITARVPFAFICFEISPLIHSASLWYTLTLTRATTSLFFKAKITTAKAPVVLGKLSVLWPLKNNAQKWRINVKWWRSHIDGLPRKKHAIWGNLGLERSK